MPEWDITFENTEIFIVKESLLSFLGNRAFILSCVYVNLFVLFY
jgi:hypothetical protein